MKKKTTQILNLLHVLTWIIFIGLLVQTGTFLVSYVVSLFNPQAAQHLYLGIDLSALRGHDVRAYSAVLSFIMGISALKAYIAYLAIRIFSCLNVAHPFSAEVGQLIAQISQMTLSAGIVAVIAQGYSKWLLKQGMAVAYAWGSEELLFLAGVIFLIAQVFRKGIDIQAEQELTI
ncbi:Protein of unknown function [Catalinimonas alkaloidigena]|uniref:DUF2975 domain-containing protein n=1 Tax=Catalinimonas alkaloidigena TaxID=1075417 RepID=A0A1G8WWG2_9BACT|nr:DUF2975 domain-containing protein [Catalinimonas alkaloidigena]SDJ82732.1 Protein of unknown function [Catalinimonas alkaloidigena]